MLKKNYFLKLLLLSLILKAAASESKNEVERNKRSVNTTIYWNWGDDQELKNIAKEVKNNVDISKALSSEQNNLLEAVKSNSEAIAQMRLETNVIKNYFENISLRLNAYIKPTEVLRNSTGPSNCAHILQNGGADGVYTLYFDTEPVTDLRVYCMLDPDGGPAWTIIQRIASKEFSTERTWDDYENGFGDVQQDHWLGLKNIYKLQNMFNDSMELWHYTKEIDHTIYFSMYRDFAIESLNSSYALKSLKHYKSRNRYNPIFQNSIGRKFTTDYKSCEFDKDDGWWCDKDGECCYGANSHYANINYVHMAIRPNSAK